jgi:penicillin-binding protein 2
VPRPHLGIEVQDSGGRLVPKIQPGARRTVHLDPVARQAVLDGIHLASSAPGGTSTRVWDGWDQNRLPVYGKTGTAQTYDHGVEYDQSWYVCWIKDTSKPNDPGIVIAVTIEKGGFGAATAAPTARLIASKFFKQKAQFIEGDSHTR